jgi:regulator of sirC expression with transglutaminase-like and TPR domain
MTWRGVYSLTRATLMDAAGGGCDEGVHAVAQPQFLENVRDVGLDLHSRGSSEILLRGLGARIGSLPVESFTALAARPDPFLDELALALAREFREVDADAALAELERLGAELAPAAGAGPAAEADALRELLAHRHGFVGERGEYDHPDNSMLDLVLERRRGLPILLSVVYVEVARRAGIALAGVGLAGHFVVGHFAQSPPLLLDPFRGGAMLAQRNAPPELQPWGAHETALRMLNNLVGSYQRRADLARTIRAAELRLTLPLAEPERAALTAELRSLRAVLN